MHPGQDGSGTRASAGANWCLAAAAGGIAIPFRLDRAVMYYIARTGKPHTTSANDGLRCECDFGATDP